MSSKEERVILVIYDDYAQCSCGGGADLDERAHTTSKSWKTPDRACGRTFTHIATDMFGALGRQWRNKRPDLEYLGVGWFAGDRDSPTFVLDIPPEHAFREDAYNYSVRKR